MKSRKQPVSRPLAMSKAAKHLPLLKAIMKTKNKTERKALLSAVEPELVDAVSTIVRNVLNGKIKIKNPRIRKVILKNHRKILEIFASPKTSHAKKLALLKGGQTGGFWVFFNALKNIPRAIGNALRKVDDEFHITK